MRSLAVKTALIVLPVVSIAVFVRTTPAGDFPPPLFWICLALAAWVPVAARHGIDRSEWADGVPRLPAGCLWALVALLLAYPVYIGLLMFVFLTVPRF